VNPADTAGKVTASRLRRDAYLYIRQPALYQVANNTEPATRQYDLRGRATALGWPAERIHVTGTGQGHSGASAAGREGFQHLVAEVSMGKAGIVLGLECSRLARNNSLFRYRNKLFCSAYGFMPRRAAPPLTGAASAAVGPA
jgi:DNA invertase Pin-like site-specific DNA recombinase